ncbi:hypothetical protein EIK77_002290 [Talaromyces pinophilus]|nr:hypothetical protein EIK77_002290 [Talaromyces pinophilus]
MYILSTLLTVIRLTIFQILAAGSLPALIFGAPVPSLLSRDVAVADVQSLQTRSSSSYTTLFGGDGTTAAGWPSMDSWVATYDEMFEANKATMSAGCSAYGFENDSEDEINDINNAIKSVSASSGVDARFILAIVMQESTGCVRVGGTNNGVFNPGLMQSHNGKGTCNTGVPLSPCPSDEITQMITDGTTGTVDGPGLQQLLQEAASPKYGASGATMYYLAARMYNSGSIAPDGNLGQGGATACYASDVANRLLGWSTGPTACQAAEIASLTYAKPASGGDSSPAPTTTTDPVASATAPAVSVTVSLDPTATATPTATPIDTTPVAPPTTTTTTTPPAATSAATSSTSSATTTLLGPVYPGAVSTCQQWTLVVSGDYCLEVENDVGISASQFMDWNPGLDAACSNLWLGYEYCVKA